MRMDSRRSAVRAPRSAWATRLAYAETWEARGREGVMQ